MSLVLVADDEPAVLEVLSNVVEDLGHEVLRAHDGNEALALARAQLPALVVTDHIMPQLSGLDLCRRLRSDARLCNVPVILLSATRPEGAPEARAFLAKPFELPDFERTVREMLDTVPRSPSPPLPPVAAEVETRPSMLRWLAKQLEVRLAVAHRQLEGEAVRSLEPFDALVADMLEAAGRADDLPPVHAQRCEAATLARQAVAGLPVRLALPPRSLPIDTDPVLARRALQELLRASRSGSVSLEVSSQSARVRFCIRFEGVAGEPGPLLLAAELASRLGGALTTEPAVGGSWALWLELPRVL